MSDRTHCRRFDCKLATTACVARWTRANYTGRPAAEHCFSASGADACYRCHQGAELAGIPERETRCAECGTVRRADAVDDDGPPTCHHCRAYLKRHPGPAKGADPIGEAIVAALKAHGSASIDDLAALGFAGRQTIATAISRGIEIGLVHRISRGLYAYRPYMPHSAANGREMMAAASVAARSLKWLRQQGLPRRMVEIARAVDSDASHVGPALQRLVRRSDVRRVSRGVYEAVA